MAANGTHARELLTLEHLTWPVWSHDGSLIAFTSCADVTDGDCRVGVLRRDGSGLIWIADAARPTWSATGRRLAFLTSFSPLFRGGPQAIAVANADGSGRSIVARSSDFSIAYKFLPHRSGRHGDPRLPFLSTGTAGHSTSWTSTSSRRRKRSQPTGSTRRGPPMGDGSFSTALNASGSSMRTGRAFGLFRGYGGPTSHAFLLGHVTERESPSSPARWRQTIWS